jgi:hypothetical protein
MKKSTARSDAGFFCGSDTELTAPAKETRRRKCKAGLEDAIVGGRRALLYTPARNPDGTEKEPTEKAIEIQIRVAVAAAGVWVQKHNIDRRSTFGSGLGIGVADLICCVPPYGRFLGIEVKRPSTRNRLSDDQKRWASAIGRFGAVVGVATSVEEALELVALARRLP